MKLLYDTDFILNLLIKGESNHERAVSIIEQITPTQEWYLKLVHFELATVLSRKFDHDFALRVLDGFSQTTLNPLDLSEKDEKETWDLFKSFKRKNISYVDCANIVVAKKNGFKILSFDKFYPKELLAT